MNDETAKSSRSKFPKWRNLVISGLAVLALWAGYRLLPYQIRRYTLFDRPFNEMKFDQKLWLTRAVWKEDEFTEKQMLRGMMFDDLVDHHLHVGMTKAEIESLLGKPDSKEDVYGTQHDDWNYLLGAWSGMRVDGDYLTVEFDKAGRSSKFWGWQS